jgi:ferredoxin
VITLKINNKKITVPEHSTILEAANQAGVRVPTLCYLNGYEHYTSCMVCVVYDVGSGCLLPSCTARVRDGQEIETDNDIVRDARKDALDLLLSEHVGNCEAPCMKSCPAYMNIPLMIRQIEEEKFTEALITVKEAIALPAVLGRICPAPCERGCNRKYLDGTLSICLLKRFVADVDLQGDNSYQPVCKEASGRHVAVVGAGPAGLAAAYYLRREGHGCTVYDTNALPGGLLRYGIPDEKLDKTVLDAEIETITNLGVQFKMKHTLGKDFSLDELQREYNAVILAMGTLEPRVPYLSGIETMSKGIAVNRRTYQTNISGIFAGGNLLAEGRMAIRSCAHGRFMAYSVNQYLNKLPVTGFPRRFNSVMGHLSREEAEQFVQLASKSMPIKAINESAGYGNSEAVREAQRCFHCDCRKPVSCKLREYSDMYGVEQRRFLTGTRKNFELIVQHETILYEPGKCIKCSLCVQITKKSGEKFGLTFIGRGFNVRVAVPLNKNLQQGLHKVALQCVEACPTAALALKHGPEEK